ncbi:MAG TPA: hypothetical protein VK956_10590, partial [Verrucomicrobium sp.]|nr:hypothetical protein [Verrucomicrobium sp.]
ALALYFAGAFSRRDKILLVVKDKQVLVGDRGFEKARVQALRATTWMQQGTPAYRVEVACSPGCDVPQESPAGSRGEVEFVEILKGAGHPLPESDLREFCGASGLRLEITRR